MKITTHELSLWVDNTHPGDLYEGIRSCLQASGLTVIDSAVHFFKGQGYTAVWLLDKSHAAVHTYPDQKSSYINLACSNKAMYDNCRQLLIDKFGSINVVEKISTPL